MLYSYDILRDLIYFHDRINDLFEEKMKSLYAAPERVEGVGWTPMVDIYETGDHIYLTAELPGVPLERIRIEVADGELLLSGYRPFPKEGLRKEDYHRLEGSYGSFERRFPLPAAVDREGIKAVLKEGVLKVEIPKVAGHAATSVPVEDH